MNPYTKVALSIIRLAAFGFVIFSVSMCASDLFLYLSPRHVQPRTAPLLAKGLPFFLGLALFWKSRPLAEYLTKNLD